MAGMSEGLRVALAAIAVKVGLKASDAKQLATLEQKLSASKAANIDELEGLKGRLSTLESLALKKKAEWDKARGEVKSIVAGEIEQIFREIDRKKGQRGILESNIDQISAAQAKIAEIKAAQLRGASDVELDDIALRAADSFERLEVSDRAAKDLEKERYKSRETGEMDVEERIKKLEKPSREKPGLGKDTLKRLKEMESEPE